MSPESISPVAANSHGDDLREYHRDDLPDDANDSSTEEEEEDDELEDEGEHEISTPVTRKDLTNIIDELKKNGPEKAVYYDLDLTKDDDVKKFMSDNKAYTDKSPEPQKQNLLHLLAEESDKDALPPVKKLTKFITALIKLPGDLLARKDDNGNTPLHKAISYRNRRLVRCMCSAHDEINRVLATQTFKSANCLHLALEKRSSTRDDVVLSMLIDKSKEDTLCAVNEKGLTPLHLAVAHNLCDDAQLKIVQELVAKCDRAIAADKTSRLGSPYRYHVHTCEEAAEKRRTEAVPERPRRAEETGPKSKGMGKLYAKTDQKADFAAGEKPQPSMEESRNRAQMKPVQSSLVEKPSGKYKDAPEPGRAFLARSATIEMPSSPIAPPSVNGDEKKRTASRKAGTAKIQPTDISVSAIKQYLKKYILRTRNHDQAMQLLYGSQQEKQINFDLSNLNQTVDSISLSQITQGLHHQAFEDVLQYIAIPQLRVEQAVVASKREAGQRPARPDGTGRTDLINIFRWLTRDKKVDTIFKIIVDDLKEPSHQDDAIESCLESVKGLETWDWKKLDLSPDVIQRAAPDARVVHMYWSGMNAVLRAWSEPEGLRKLKHLEEGSETKARTQRNVAEFKQRMQTGTNIRVVESKLKDDNPKKANSPTYTVKDEYERHKWVEIMENFAEFLQIAEARTATQITMKEPIRIAVIDDGVNSFDSTIDSKVMGGRSFSYRDEEQTLVNPYYVSSEGHGTAMAGFIRKICPNVEIYALRLDEYSVEQGKRYFTAASAEKAVRDAREKKVHIISMSWTIEKTETNKTEVEKLEKAIARAAEDNILMFCAAADGGAQRDRTYPAATASTKNIFMIGAAEPAGTATKWLGETLVDFIFPGHEVVRERQDDPGVTKYTPKTGSSVATALASGLAALVLYCVQLAAVARQKKGAAGGGRTTAMTTSAQQSLSNLAGYQALKNHERMKEAFLQIGTTKDKYIRVWERFEKPVKDAEMRPKDEWMDCVEALAETFTRQL
ncbi:intracellular serine protease [Apiospora marii]|uniref:Intracellular serine protease n=1 Tax=Apiospora marii TaxID=335849 RepID=A0ABR1RZQ9_9PEZI